MSVNRQRKTSKAVAEPPLTSLAPRPASKFEYTATDLMVAQGESIPRPTGSTEVSDNSRLNQNNLPAKNSGKTRETTLTNLTKTSTDVSGSRAKKSRSRTKVTYTKNSRSQKATKLSLNNGVTGSEFIAQGLVEQFDTTRLTGMDDEFAFSSEDVVVVHHQRPKQVPDVSIERKTSQNNNINNIRKVVSNSGKVANNLKAQVRAELGIGPNSADEELQGNGSWIGRQVKNIFKAPSQRSLSLNGPLPTADQMQALRSTSRNNLNMTLDGSGNKFSTSQLMRKKGSYTSGKVLQTQKLGTEPKLLRTLSIGQNIARGISSTLSRANKATKNVMVRKPSAIGGNQIVVDPENEAKMKALEHLVNGFETSLDDAKDTDSQKNKFGMPERVNFDEVDEFEDRQENTKLLHDYHRNKSINAGVSRKTSVNSSQNATNSAGGTQISDAPLKDTGSIKESTSRKERKYSLYDDEAMLKPIRRQPGAIANSKPNPYKKFSNAKDNRKESSAKRDVVKESESLVFVKPLRNDELLDADAQVDEDGDIEL